MSTFEPGTRHKWQTYATVSHDDRTDISLYVSADKDEVCGVRLSAHVGYGSSSIKLTAARARALAAELIAAADSLDAAQQIAEAA